MGRREREQLLHRRMLKLMAECDLNLARVGRVLSYHRNAVAYHLDKIQEETGKDPRTFYGLCQLLGYEKKEEP